MSSAANPYSNPDADDDIFQPAQPLDSVVDGRKHVLDGSMCHCGIEHHLKLPFDTPPEVLEQLSEFIDKLPDRTIDIIVTEENSLAMKLLNDFVEFADSLDSVNRGGPLLRAMAETIDVLAGGGVIGPLVRFYEAEQHVVATHILIKTLNSLRESIKRDAEKTDSEDERQKVAHLFEVMDTILESSFTRLEKAVEQYTRIAEETENNIDQQVIDTGTFSDNASYFASRLIHIPMIKASDAGDDEDEDDSSEKKETE